LVSGEGVEPIFDKIISRIYGIYFDSPGLVHHIRETVFIPVLREVLIN
jgi:hypothetical protein